MSLPKFREQLLLSIPLDTMNPEQMLIINFLDTQILEQKAKFKLNKDSNRFTFGKYKGYTVEEIIRCPSGKGTSYLEWLICQSFFTDVLYPDLYAQLKECKIKKKIKIT